MTNSRMPLTTPQVLKCIEQQLCQSEQPAIAFLTNTLEDIASQTECRGLSSFKFYVIRPIIFS